MVGDPEAVAQLIAEKVAAMNISPGPNSQQDSNGDVLALPAPAPEVHVDPSAKAQACTTGMIQAPVLYNTSGNISSVQLAWSEWSFGSTTIAERVKQIKADNTLVMGRRNSHLHKKNRHLPQLTITVRTAAFSFSIPSPAVQQPQMPVDVPAFTTRASQTLRPDRF